MCWQLVWMCNLLCADVAIRSITCSPRTNLAIAGQFQCYSRSPSKLAVILPELQARIAVIASLYMPDRGNVTPTLKVSHFNSMQGCYVTGNINWTSQSKYSTTVNVARMMVVGSRIRSLKLCLLRPYIPSVAAQPPRHHLTVFPGLP
jgi:hypothetical protein